MEWNDRYALGIEQIDYQHQELFRAINRINKILQEGDLSRNQRTCAEAIRFLKNYTWAHFQAEEDYQQSINYENYEQHKRVHDNFRATILEYEENFMEGPFTYESVLEFVNTLQFWLVNHILFQDQRIAARLQDETM